MAIKSRRKRWAGYIARIAQIRNIYRNLVELSERKRPLGRSRWRYKDES
jgi:hypothetical protein